MTALANYQARAPQITQVVEVLPLTTPAEIDRATVVLRSIKALHASLEAERKALVGPLKTEAKEIDERYRAPRRELERVERLLKTRIADVHMRAEEERTAALQAASNAAKGGDTAAAHAAVVQAGAGAPETPGVSVRYEWGCMVENVALVPREYLTVDVAKIKTIAKAHGGGPTPPEAIPGLKWHRKPIVSARAL